MTDSSKLVVKHDEEKVRWQLFLAALYSPEKRLYFGWMVWGSQWNKVHGWSMIPFRQRNGILPILKRPLICEVIFMPGPPLAKKPLL